MLIGFQKFTVDFKSCDRKFDWLEVSLVYNKSDKHLTISGGLNTECAAKKIKSVELANTSEAYSVANAIKFHTSNDTKNICSGNNSSLGNAKDIAQQQFLTTLTIQFFRATPRNILFWG